MSKINVYSPAKGFNGVSVGVAFTDGHALVDQDSAAFRYFKRKGYYIGAQPEEGSNPDVVISDAFSAADGESGEVHGPEEPVAAVEVDIPGMPKSDASRGEFAEFAEGMGLETEGLTKAKIIDKIKEEAKRV